MRKSLLPRWAALHAAVTFHPSSHDSTNRRFTGTIGQSLLAAFTALLLFSGAARAQILSNGGFESGTTGWTNALSNGGAATFSITTTSPHSGTNALQVAVTNAGTSSTSVETMHSAFTASSSSTYVLQFWAHSDLNYAKLQMRMQGGATFNISYDTSNLGWQLYRYSFKASGSVSLAFDFQSVTNYYIDDISIIDQSDPNVDVAMTYIWDHSRSGFSWNAGDNDTSVGLPDGRSAWILNDSWVGTANINSNIQTSGSTMLHNVIVVQNGSTLTTIIGGTQSAPKAVMNATTSGDYYWIGDAIIENGKMKVLLTEINSSASFADKLAVAVFTLPGITLDSITTLAYSGPDDYKRILGGDDNFNYIYSGGLKLARVQKGALESNPWTYFNGTDWVSDSTQAVAITNAGTKGWGGTPVRLGYKNYAMVSIPNLSTKVEVSFAQDPTGPWTASTVIYQGPSQTSLLNYDAFVHRETRQNGMFTISYSINGTTGGLQRQLNDRDVYVPYYIKANLVDLSPYSTQQFETESLTATWTSGRTHRIITSTSFSGGEGTILDATAVNDQVTYTLPDIGAGTYDVRVGVKKTTTRGIYQLAAASAITQSYSNVGSTQDEYSSSDQYVELDLGNWFPGSNSDKLFKFTVTGKNASSSGYTIAFDYIKLILQ